MRTCRWNLWIIAVAVSASVVAAPGRLPGQTSAATSYGTKSGPPMRWSVQVDRVDPGDLDLAYSFQAAIYENLIGELKKSKQFVSVLRDGDHQASTARDLLVLKTTVEKYTPGSETRRAVTTVSGATKLTVRSQLFTSDGKVVFERNVNGDVRFFGSNLRSTQILARNIAKALKQSSWSGPEQSGAMVAGQP